MKKTLINSALFGILLTTGTYSQAATVYKCKQPDGTIQYSQDRCKEEDNGTRLDLNNQRPWEMGGIALKLFLDRQPLHYTTKETAVIELKDSAGASTQPGKRMDDAIYQRYQLQKLSAGVYRGTVVVDANKSNPPGGPGDYQGDFSSQVKNGMVITTNVTMELIVEDTDVVSE